MITNNVIQRTFHIQVGNSTGTCFTIDVDTKQYLITAKHIVRDCTGIFLLKILHEQQWKEIQVSLVGHCPNDIDISILSAQFQLSPTFPLEPTSQGLVYGQDVYFLGFPYGMGEEVGNINRNFPLPFVKKAIVSCLQTKENGGKIVYLDGHNNPGFSGGPVVFRETNTIDYKVMSVISYL